MFSENFNNICKKKLWSELSEIEVHQDGEDLWFFVDEVDEWIFRFVDDLGLLEWNLEFFENFFSFFSLDEVEYEPILVSFVQEILPKKIKRSRFEEGDEYYMKSKRLKRKK